MERRHKTESMHNWIKKLPQESRNLFLTAWEQNLGFLAFSTAVNKSTSKTPTYGENWFQLTIPAKTSYVGRPLSCLA